MMLNSLRRMSFCGRNNSSLTDRQNLAIFMSIVDNRKAFHDYFIEDRYEAGIVLEGWEVKAIRESRVQIKEAYVVVRGD